MKAGVVLALWLVGSAGALTASALPKLLPREAPKALQESGLADSFQLPMALDSLVVGRENKPIWINAWRYGCPCSADREKEVKQLAYEFQDRFELVHLLSVGFSKEEEVMKEWDKKGIPGRVIIDSDGKTALKLGLWAAPTALVLNKEGKVVFRGSYNIARSCFEDSSAYGKMALSAASKHKMPQVQEVPSYGCSIIP